MRKPEEPSPPHDVTAAGVHVKVRDVMTAPVTTVREDATVEDAARLMLDLKVGGLPVVDANDRLVGLVTESDYTGEERYVPFSTFRHARVFGEWLGKEGLERVHEKARNLRVRDVMHAPAAVVGEDDSVEVVVQAMLREDVNRLPVVRDGRVVGIVTRHDLLRMMVGGPGRSS